LTGGYGNLIRDGYEAWNGGDRSFVLGHLSSDVVWITPPDDPDQGVYRGHEAVKSFWDQWHAAVGQLQFELVELNEAKNRVLAVVRRSGVGHHSGLEVSDLVCQVFFFDDDGTCSLVREFYDRSKAAAAAGMPEHEESHSGRKPAHN
jgi:ketosteroid isomerase-like protein